MLWSSSPQSMMFSSVSSPDDSSLFAFQGIKWLLRARCLQMKVCCNYWSVLDTGRAVCFAPKHFLMRGSALQLFPTHHCYIAAWVCGRRHWHYHFPLTLGWWRNGRVKLWAARVKGLKLKLGFDIKITVPVRVNYFYFYWWLEFFASSIIRTNIAVVRYAGI